MQLDLLPVRTGGAAENMAVDFLLLQRYPDEAHARFRHYDWRAPAFTFGYGQKIAYVRQQLPPDEHVELCRRPTGGGVVDHRADWTYTLVVPRRHALYDERATQSYRIVHEVLARSLQFQGQAVELKPCAPSVDSDETGAPTICFNRAEVFDVVNPVTGAKVAGAAQKRNKHGLLFQGSIWKPAVGTIDWDLFQDAFTSGLSSALASEPVETSWPDFAENEVEGLIEQYSSTEWVEYR